MKYCKNCGEKLDDDAKFCPKCGEKIKATKQEVQTTENTENTSANPDTLGSVAFVFMILSCIFLGVYLIPLIWCIPMTVCLNRQLKSGEPIGVGFKVCILIFVSLIAGILLLCRTEKSQN